MKNTFCWKKQIFGVNFRVSTRKYADFSFSKLPIKILTSPQDLATSIS